VYLKAKEKAIAAYGRSVEQDLNKAIAILKDRRGRLGACMRALKITEVPEALLWSQIKKLV